MSANVRSRYEILDEIASGGMATVYVGRLRGALGFQRLVAIKRAHSFVANDPIAAKTLEREARLAAHIRHPNVVAILDVEEVDDEFCLILEYVEGCSLKDIFREAQRVHGGKPPDRAFQRAAIRMLLDAGEGLMAVHRAVDANGAPLALVHRDVSPHNVLVGKDGSARIADFGIARAEATAGERTSTGILKGKLAYSPPEYLESQIFDERGDLFSFAVVIWELLAGRPLFAGPMDAATLRNVLACRVPPLDGEGLESISPLVTRALSLRPNDRFATVGEFLEPFEAAARELDLVGTRTEVAALVERSAGELLSARALRISKAAPRSLREIQEARKAPFARDNESTASLVGLKSDVAPSPSSASTAPAESNGDAISPPRPPSKRARLVLGSSALIAVGLIVTAVARREGAPRVETPSERPKLATPSVAVDTASSAVDPPKAAAALSTTEATLVRVATSATSTLPSSSPPPRAKPVKRHTASPIPSHAPTNPYGH